MSSDGTAAVLTATPTTDPSDRATADLVERLRDDTIPKATAGKDMTRSSAVRRPATSTSRRRSGAA